MKYNIFFLTALIIISIFSFNSCRKHKTTLPVLTTTTISNITVTTATSGGNVSSDGGAEVTTRGVCWGTTTGPVVTNSHTSDGTGIGSFTSTITGLKANMTYYLRAYATNKPGDVVFHQIQNKQKTKA